MECLRSITFVIPGEPGEPDVRVTAIEADGAIEFTVEVLTTDTGVTADLRGLFFDLSDADRIDRLAFLGDDVTDHIREA